MTNKDTDSRRSFTDINRRLLPFWWLAAIAGALTLSSHFRGESTHFLGIADDREQTIRFETPVEVLRTHVVAGQAVSEGALLLEVMRGELATQQAILLERLAELRARDIQERSSMGAEILRLRAESEARSAALNNEIKDLQYRRRFNREYLDQLTERDQRPDNASSADDPMAEQIAGLRAQRQAFVRAMQARVHDLESQLNADPRPYDAQIAELEKQLQELDRQETQLTVHAQFDGRIGSVMFKEGETIAPYQPILTVHSAKPTYIQGYINENVFNRIRIGESVQIQRTNPAYDDVAYTGVVESLGTRIVEYPERLRRNALASAWGREVVVRITDDHALLLGEKVRITASPLDAANANWAQRSTQALRVWLRLDDRELQGSSNVSTLRSGHVFARSTVTPTASPATEQSQ